MKTRKLAIAACIAAVSISVHAQDAGRLGQDLTFVGAEKAGNADGSIPAWEGQSGGSGWSYGKNRADHFKYKSDKPLYTIDAGNADKYAAKLTPGQIALLKENKAYQMDVYPSRRVCAVPEQIRANTKQNVGYAKLAQEGTELDQAALPGVPFPMPANGSEAIWNFLTRYQGAGSSYVSENSLVSPRPDSDSWIKISFTQFIYIPWGGKGVHSPKDNGNSLGMTYFLIDSPTALAGQALMSKMFTNNKSNEVFYYFPGQRRVRRMPTYEYDAPQIGFENTYTVDETLMFTGRIDRFDWKLVGKKEILVPYNSFGMYDFAGKQEDIYKKSSVARESRRYESHRVWVVEATTKASARHVTTKKVFYIDEDSWNVVVGEDYDAKGKIWKVREASLIPVWELGGACGFGNFVQYDLQAARYVADFVTAGTGKDIRWYADTDGKKGFTPDFYTSDNLRSISER